MKKNVASGHKSPRFSYSKLYVCLVIFTMTFAGCKKFVEVDLPENSLLDKAVFSKDETASSAMLGVYGQMIDGGVNPLTLSLSTGISSDEMTSYNLSDGDMYINALTSRNFNLAGFWPSAYKNIYMANAVYIGCQESISLNNDVKQQLMGEALFVRAYWHFYMFNLFGDVPIITTTNYSVNATVKRSPRSEVLKQIIADLSEAIEKLKPVYVDANSTTESSERIRPNKYAAIALLARAYLYNGDYAKAEQQSTSILDNTSMYSLTALNDVFLPNSQEAIWQLKATSPSGNPNTPEGLTYILQSSPVLDGSQSLSPQLTSAFETNDQRFNSWVGVFKDNSVTPSMDYYYAYKYKVKGDAAVKEYSMVLRLAEQYLIRAECRAQNGNLAGSIADVDKIRDRASLPLIANINPTISKDALLAAIMKERRVELFAEQGHRWLDLKRTGQVDAVMKIVTPLKGGSWATYKQLWPIPRTEILNDANLTQNEGYN